MDATPSSDTAPHDSAHSDRAPRPVIDIGGILDMLPHRYPLLLIDRVIDVVRGESGVALKNVTYNENFFQGHFPGHPVMPGVLIIEAMAQTAAVLVMDALGQNAAGSIVYFMSIDSAKFRRPVVPGDQLRIHCQKVQRRAAVWKFRGTAKVDDLVVADALFAAMILNDKRA